MPQPQIRFDHVYKKFSKGQKFDSLRDYLPALAKRWASRSGDELQEREFWSVRDVSFTVKPGQVLGIIGHNGAGKSTILKLLTKILRPTRGNITLRGRVGALIEVAAGFHPDLTGRENVFLQGSIMGMRRREIALRFDEIVEFSGISEFIDTPVKRYSSGMNARLGFSIAAHLDPDVLIIDEVLAVGDAAFQQRAFERLASLANESRPVVVVSHQLDRILSLCTDAILMERGVAATIGTPQECVLAYTAGLGMVQDAPDVSPFRFTSVRVTPDTLAPGDPFRVTLDCDRHGVHQQDFTVGFSVRSSTSEKSAFATSTGRFSVPLPDGETFRVGFDLKCNLGGGIYYVDAHAYDRVRGITVHGPRCLLTVNPALTFTGGTNLEPRVSVTTADIQDRSVTIGAAEAAS